MSHSDSAADILNILAETLVVKQQYASREEALRYLAASAVRSKMNYYRRRIRILARKYETDFETFTTRLQGRATPAEEDDWLAWRSARQMLADWQHTYRTLRHGAAR